MDSDRIRKELEEELSRCVRCGACRNLCPVFYAENREDSSPRGKNTLLMHLLEGDFQSYDVRKLLSSCTLCEACITGCPNEVHTYRVVLYGRILSPPPFPEREVYSLFNNNSLMKNGEKLLSLIQERFFIKKENLYQLKWRIGGIDKYIPEVPSKDFFALYREMPNQEKYEKKVLFFVGCLIRYLYPETGIHLVEILNEYGWGVIAPEEQVCCGLPAISNGLLEEFLKSMRTNVGLFNKYDYPYILSACGSCGNTLKNYYPDFKRESDLETEAVESFSSRIADVSEFFVKELRLHELVDEFSAESVTYHDSCHLNRGMGISNEPRILLQKNRNYKELNESDVCCGFGGSFSVKNYDASQKMLQRKMDNVKESGAKTLVAGCPGCVLQLSEGSAKYLHSEVRVKHLVDYIYEKIILRI